LGRTDLSIASPVPFPWFHEDYFHSSSGFLKELTENSICFTFLKVVDSQRIFATKEVDGNFGSLGCCIDSGMEEVTFMEDNPINFPFDYFKVDDFHIDLEVDRCCNSLDIGCTIMDDFNKEAFNFKAVMEEVIDVVDIQSYFDSPIHILHYHLVQIFNQVGNSNILNFIRNIVIMEEVVIGSSTFMDFAMVPFGKDFIMVENFGYIDLDYSLVDDYLTFGCKVESCCCNLHLTIPDYYQIIILVIIQASHLIVIIIIITEILVVNLGTHFALLDFRQYFLIMIAALMNFFIWN